MADVLTFDMGRSLKGRFKAAGEPVAKPTQTVDVGVSKTVGYALYLAYRYERTQQQFEEWKWESLDIAQQLVWERLANRLGLTLTQQQL